MNDSPNNFDLLNCLVNLGLSEREAKVLLVLLNRRHATATDLQKGSGIPQAKVYETVGRLVRQGYCRERRVGTRRSFEAIDPKISLTPAFDRAQQRWLETIGLKSHLEALYAGAGDFKEPVEYIEILHGKDNIHPIYCELVRNAREEILGFGKPPYACDTPDRVSEQAREYQAFAKRGGVSRWVYELDSTNRGWLINGLRNLGNGAGHIRVADMLPLKMMIFDCREVLVAQENPYTASGELTMAVIKHHVIANAYRALFDFFWQQAQKMEELETNAVELDNLGKQLK
jgi:sugar-specific transcriptional regulator TrmB